MAARPTSILFALGAAALAAVLGSCRAAPHATAESRIYPAQTPRAANLDIQVVRRQTAIEFTNTTARDLPACTMWLNMRFGRKVDALAIGRSMTLDLEDFKDENGEPFRGGGFFAREQPQKLVLAQLELTDEHGAPALLGLTVVAGGED